MMIFLPFLHFLSFIVCTFLAVFVLYKDAKSLLNRMVAVLMLCYALWNFGDIVLHNPDQSITAETVMTMQHIASFGWISFASALLCFSLVFSKNQKLLRNKWFLTIIIIIPVLLIYKQLTNDLTINPLKQPYGWSVDWADTIWSYLFYAYYLIFTLLSVVIIYIYGRRTKIVNEKKQTKIIVVVFIAGIFAGTLLDVLIQNLGLRNVPAIANLMVFVFASGVLYAVYKYRFLAITPTIAAENIISAMDEFLILLNADGNILTINKAAKDTLKYENYELEGKSISLLFQGDNFNNNISDKILNRETISNQDSCFLAKNGRIIPIIYSSSPLRNNIGTVMGTVFIARDITDRRKAEQALEESNGIYRTLIEKMPDGVYKTSHSGKVLEINPAMIRILGYSKEELLGINIGEELYFDPSDRERLTIEGITSDLISYRLRKKDGSEVWVEDHGWYTYDDSGEILFHEGIIRDISERKHVEKELIISKEHAEESDRLKSAFLANMSHEIRTPMNGILGFADLLKNPDLSGEDQQNYIRIIEKSGDRMLNIINDIIDISKIEAGLMKIDIKESNINEQTEYIYTFFKPEVESKGMRLYLRNSLPAKEATIKTDREKVFAILTNLVKNAIKYTDQGLIEFGYEKVKLENAWWLQFFVKDTGIGIPIDRQEAVFERFVQADVKDKNAYQGAGLGLAITKAYVEMMGGKIRIESEPGNGSTIYFTLPYNVAEDRIISADDAETVGKHDERSGELKILIAEDDEISKMLIFSIVKEIAREVLVAISGSKAIEIFRDNADIDLILMDIQMPDINGYDATRRIRQFNTNVVIIAQTAFAQTGDREKAIAAGCNDYISKPISKDKLLALIEKYCNKK